MVPDRKEDKTDDIDACSTCRKKTYGIYHCIKCCKNMEDRKELFKHNSKCDGAILNPIMEDD